MITQLELTNFSAFSHLKIDFSNQINIIVGKNSTGKTKLMKAAYAIASGGHLPRANPKTAHNDFTMAMSHKLVRLFLPLNRRLGELVWVDAIENANSDRTAEIKAQLENDAEVNISFTPNSQSVKVVDNASYRKYSNTPIFIPTKEIISFMEGFNSLYEKYDLSFDQTYKDMYISLELPRLRQENLHPIAKTAMTEIEALCGGRFIFHGGGKVTFRAHGGAEYSANSVAEGFRKMGILARLFETGEIDPNESRVLFWDEPEANLNPDLMRLLVNTLLDLSRSGQQIIIATHDYVLLKWFDLLAKQEGDRIAFHTLSRNQKTNEIEVETVDNYLAVIPNAITDTYKEITKEQVRQTMGDLGK